MKKEVLHYPEELRKAMPWPRATKAGNLAFVGVAGFGRDGDVVGPGFEEQATRCFEELKEALEALGTSLENILQMVVYYTHIREDVVKMPAIRRRYIPDDKMFVVLAIGVKELFPSKPPLRVEMACTAIIPDAR